MSYMDLVQEGTLILMDAIEKIPTGTDNPGSHINMRLKFDLLEALSGDSVVTTPCGKERLQIESLDAPLYENEEITLADVLPMSLPETRNERRVRALHDALHRLGLQQQRVLKEYFQIEAFIPFGISGSRAYLTAQAYRQAGIRQMRKDVLLFCAM